MIPNSWKRVPLGRAGNWFCGGTPSKAHPANWVGTIPWVSPKDMKRLRIADAEDHLSDAAATGAARVVPAGAILVVVRGMILAHSFPVARTTVPVAFNQDMRALVPAPDLDGDFVLYWLESQRDEVLKLVDVANHGTKRLPSEQFFGLSLPVPPLAEQRKIAAILSSVDETIEKTEAVIAQLDVVKKAMLEELLSRGIPGRHSRFKQTEIGEVPEAWSVKPLGESLHRIDAGWSPQCEQRPADSEEWGVLKVSSVTSEAYRPAENKALPATLTPRPELEVKVGDVLVARANGVLDLVGRACFVDATRPRLMLSDKTLRLRPRAEDADSFFLWLLLQRQSVRERLMSTTAGGYMRNLSQAALRAVLVALPPVEEQRVMSSAIGAVVKRHAVEREALECLVACKNALASGLLGGDIRTTDALESS